MHAIVFVIFAGNFFINNMFFLPHSSLLGNPLKCTCQIEWLADLLKSDKELPDFDGATCRDAENVPFSLTSSSLSFDYCPGICVWRKCLWGIGRTQ